jgi:acyl dehydratase
MSLDIQSVGATTDRFVLEYDWKAVALYALGVGAKKDELDFVYEGRGPRVLPTFAIVPSYGPVWALFERTRCDMTKIFHGGQSITIHRPIPAKGRFETVGTVHAIYDMKRFAQVVLKTKSEISGELVCETEWSVLVRDAGGFGGPRPPKSDSPSIPDRDPDFTIELETTPEQALLYRLSGDENPLHADPEVATSVGFAEGPILHGLCTFGVVGRALVRGACQGDETRLTRFGAQFRRPVWPGDTLKTTGYLLDGGQVALEAFAGGRPEPVITSAWAQIARR